jgi:hypothetical protein
VNWLCGGLAPEAIAHPAGQLRQRLAHYRRGERLKAQLPPVDVLAGGQHPGQLIGVAPLWVVQLWGADVVDRQDEVLVAQLPLAGQEALDLAAAGGLRKKLGVMIGMSRVTASKASSILACQFCPQVMSLRS